MYEDGYEKHWAELEASAEEFSDEKEALAHFHGEFMDKKDLLKDRCIFIRDVNGRFAATAMVWPGNHLGLIKERIHWVCVHQDYQGKGLAKAILTKALDIFNSLGNDEMIYLTTQTNSYKAVNIYLKFGFRQFEGEKPDAWKCTESWEEDIEKAWEIINVKINEYRKL
jgi:GNAT superfamily N-acetyltransferase